MAERIGVYICHCGSNIAGMVDVEEVARWVGTHLDDVVVSKDYRFMCSSLGQQIIEDDIRNEGLTRVVVAACSPHLHEATFRRACANAGLATMPRPSIKRWQPDTSRQRRASATVHISPLATSGKRTT